MEHMGWILMDIDGYCTHQIEQKGVFVVSKHIYMIMISWYEHLTISVQCVHCISLYISL